MILINGECLEEMDKLIAEGVKVDAIITDIPYGTTACKWDSVIPFEPMWERLNKLIKDNGAIVLFGSEPFSSALRMSNIKHYKYDWIWNKNKASSALNCNYQPLKVHEIISVFGKKATTYSTKGNMNYYPQELKEVNILTKRENSKKTSLFHTNPNINTIQKYSNYPKSIININTEKKYVHPTQKPVELIEYFIKTYTQENELVLDFTMGSGSTGVACKHLNRDFIGIELDKNYYDIAVKRIKEE